MQQDEYDIGAAFAAIEEELTASMMRNMKRHRAEETKEGIQWSMWQAEQLKALERYKRENRKRYAGKFQSLNREIEELIRKARETGGMEQERAILNAVRNGFKAEKISSGMKAEFFKLNERKLEALIEAVTHDMEKAETAVLRMTEDQYRKIIFNAQVYANTGAGTYEQAVDMASRDFLAAGLNCIQYANGARHTLSDYADMAIRTASKRAYLQGEGEKRQEWRISTVIMNKRGNPCPKCLPFVGKVLIDDVWSGGRKDGVDPETGKRYPLMSKAIEAGLYHPRCKDFHTTYFPGISTADDTWTKKELEAIGQNYAREQKEQYAERQEEKYGRLAEHSLDEENQKRYAARREEWKKRHAVFNKENTKSEIHTIKSQIADIQEQMNDNIKQKLFNKGIRANIEGAGEYHKEAFEALKHLDKLTDEYRSTIASYTVGKTAYTQTEYGTAYTLNGKTAVTVQPIAHRINKAIDALGLGKKQPLGTTYHEFAHSLSQSREKVDPEFWKEIRKIKREYEGIRGKSNWFDVKISDYASKDVDEFLAEAFTQAKLSDTPSPYSKRVLDVVDKYFKKKSIDVLGGIPDIKFATKKNSAITAKQKFKDTITVSQAYSELPIKVKHNMNNIIFEFGYDGSACDIQNKLIRVGIGTSKEEVFHETGHLIEHYMMSLTDVRKYKEFLVEGLSWNDIMVKTYYDNAGNGIDIYLLKGTNFESEYQSRLYVLNPFEALNEDGTINVDTLGEAISEVFRKYMNGEKISQEAQELIERTIRWA